MWVKKGGRGKKIKKNDGEGAGGEFDPRYGVFPCSGPRALLLIGLICGKMRCHYSYPALTARPGDGNSREESVV